MKVSFLPSIRFVFVTWALLLGMAHSQTPLVRQGAHETAEWLARKFAPQLGQTTTQALTQRISAFAGKYGDDALLALRKVGPEAFQLVEKAGTHGSKAARLLALHGEAGASLVLRRPQAMQQFLRYGEGAAAALVKHPGAGEILITRFGQQGITGAIKISGQSGRRLAMLAEGELANLSGGHAGHLMEVVGKYGDRAVRWLWENKGKAAFATLLVAFLHDPEPFLKAAEKTAQVVTKEVVAPITKEGARSTAGAVRVVALLAGVGIVVAASLAWGPALVAWLRSWLCRRYHRVESDPEAR
jgi:hypothetical protein